MRCAALMRDRFLPNRIHRDKRRSLFGTQASMRRISLVVEGYGNWYSCWRKKIPAYLGARCWEKLNRPGLHGFFQEKQSSSNRHIKVSGGGSLSFFPHRQQNLAGLQSQVVCSGLCIQAANMPTRRTIANMVITIQPNKSIRFPLNNKHRHVRMRVIDRPRSHENSSMQIKKLSVTVLILAFSRYKSSTWVGNGKKRNPSDLHHLDMPQSFGVKRAAIQPAVDLRLR